MFIFAYFSFVGNGAHVGLQLPLMMLPTIHSATTTGNTCSFCFRDWVLYEVRKFEIQLGPTVNKLLYRRTVNRTFSLIE